MLSRRRFACGITAALLLAGCALNPGRGLAPGASSEEVRASMGAPDRVWKDADGGQSWEYDRTEQTYMARIDGNGKLIRLDQVVTRDNARRVQYGWPAEDVERLLGRPQVAGRDPRSGRRQWTWHYRGAYHEPLRFDVYLNDLGYVVGTSVVEEGSP